MPALTTLTSLEKLSLYNENEFDIGDGIMTNLTWLEATQIPMHNIAQLTNLKHLDIRYAEDKRIEVCNIFSI